MRKFFDMAVMIFVFILVSWYVEDIKGINIYNGYGYKTSASITTLIVIPIMLCIILIETLFEKFFVFIKKTYKKDSRIKSAGRKKAKQKSNKR